MLHVHCRLVPREGVVDTYVVEGEAGSLVSMISFYSLPSSILGHPDHKDLRAAYMFYMVPGPTPLKQLVNDALVLARSKG
jgi:glycylpeptide N-tetradecanoyltransferase